MNYRKATKKYYEKYAKEFKEAYDELDKPVKITFHFVRGTKHKFDYLNPAQTVQDDMVKHGWIVDDNADFIIPDFDAYTYDKNDPGVWIELIIDEKETTNTDF